LAGEHGRPQRAIRGGDLLLFGKTAASVVFALGWRRIGEQVDFLRFLARKTGENLFFFFKDILVEDCAAQAGGGLLILVAAQAAGRDVPRFLLTKAMACSLEGMPPNPPPMDLESLSLRAVRNPIFATWR